MSLNTVTGNLNAVLFYIFSGILGISSFLAVFSKRSVHSVLWLILSFFGAAWVFISLKADFIAMLLIIIYVGAIAVLFLFVVMMLEDPLSKIEKTNHGKITFTFSAIFGMLLFIELFIILITAHGLPKTQETTNFNIYHIGKVLYTEYFFEFQTTGLLFFAAMIGAIILTLEGSPKGKQQNMAVQAWRDKSSISLVKPSFRSGVKTK